MIVDRDIAGALDTRDGEISVGDWWEYHHQGTGDHLRWLTGSKGPEVWKRLCVLPLVSPGRRVLNIGVGEGYCTNHLARSGCLVQVLDISPAALEKVSGVTERGWLPSEMTGLPPDTFDLAISHLVAQHMTDEDLLEQVRCVLYGLKRTGIFAVQMLYAHHVSLPGVVLRQAPSVNDLAEVPPELVKGGGVCRSMSHTCRLVEEAGGAVASAWHIAMFPELGLGWHGFHIVRRDFEWDLIRQI